MASEPYPLASAVGDGPVNYTPPDDFTDVNDISQPIEPGLPHPPPPSDIVVFWDQVSGGQCVLAGVRARVRVPCHPHHRH